MSEWISVKDRLPYKGEFALLMWEEKHEYNTHGAFWGHDKVTFNWKNNQWEGPMTGAITHWMPLPNPPDDKKPLEE